MMTLAAGLAGGCNSPQIGRIDNNRDIYENWPIETREKVLAGTVEQGMTPDMVWMAAGEPTEIVSRTGTPKTGEDEVWIYRTGGDEVLDPMATPFPNGPYPANYPGANMGNGGGVVLGRGGAGVVMSPTIGIGGNMGGMGTSPMPTRRTPVDEREIVFKDGVVVRADPPPPKT